MRFKRVALSVLLIIAVLAVEWVWLNARTDRSAGDPVPIITTHAAATVGARLVGAFLCFRQNLQ